MRTTGVKLIAETGIFRRKMRESKSDVVDLKDELEETGKRRDLEEQAQQAATLSRRIKETEGAVVSLARQFAATGGDDSGIGKQLKQQQRLLRDLRSTEKLLPKPQDIARFGERMGALLGDGLAKSPLSPTLSMVVLGGAVAVAPLLGGAISAAVIGGAGVGGVIGGLALASKDARVEKEITALGVRLSDRLNGAAGGFVQPALDGIKTIRKAVDTIDIEQIFQDSSRFVAPLVSDTAKAIEDIGNGIEKLVANAGPVIDVIGEGIAEIGQELGDGLADLSANGDGAAAALRDIFAIVSFGISSTMNLVNILTKLYEINKKLGGDLFLQLMLKATGSALDDTAESARNTGSGFFGAAKGINAAEDAAVKAKAAQTALTAAQKQLTASQDQYTASLDQLAPKQGRAAQLTDGLRLAAQKLYGATIAQTDANEGYEASFDSLSETVEANSSAIGRSKNSLDIHTKAGRSNRDALQALLTANNESYYANIATGMSVEGATKKHRERTAQVVKESEKLGLNRGETKKLIDTYGKIPGRKATDLVIEGLNQIMIELRRVYLAQRALAEGKTVNQVRYEGTAAMRSLLADGGPVRGPGGPRSDSVPAMLSNGEYVINAASTAQIGVKTLDHANTYGELPQFAKGGFVAPVETRRRIPMAVEVGGSYVMPRALALSKVTPPMPTGGRTGPWIERTAKALVDGIRVISGYRPGARTLSGNQSLHALDRARDFGPSEELARKWDALYGSRTTEAITPYQRYNRLHGKRHTYTGAIWNQHNFAGGNAHDHIAMKDGGVIREPVMGVGRSGATYSFGEGGVHERVTPIGSGGGGGTTIVNNVTIAPKLAVGMHPRKVAQEIAEAITPFFEAGGQIRVRGQLVAGLS